jgi:dolichol-phosphate mannosyltransferase
VRSRFLTALPVYNEAPFVSGVLDEVVRFAGDVLVVDDGSDDGTAELLARRDDVLVVAHRANRGYGAALITAFGFAAGNHYDTLVTIDCDGQHEPQRIPELVAALANEDADIASGSRYLREFAGSDAAPGDRRRINHLITAEVNASLGLLLTDTFCGFKAYRVEALGQLVLTEPGYAMPLELWVQAVAHGLKIVEIAVPRVYLEEDRSFGGALDDAQTRLAHYRDVLTRAITAAGRTGADSIPPDRTVPPDRTTCAKTC